MKRLGTFPSKRWGQVTAFAGTYKSADGPLAVFLDLVDDQYLTQLSVNMYRPACSHDSEDLPRDCFYVKTWNENELIACEALASGLFKERPDLPRAESGFVVAPVWQLAGAA